MSNPVKIMIQLVEIQYFGCVSLYQQLIHSKHVVFEQYETFQKMGYRNRCQVLGPEKVLDLSVPLKGGRDQKAFTREIEIANENKWQVQQWRTLESCYNKSPFFYYYRDSLEKLMFTPYKRLWELDLASFNWVLGKLKLSIQVEFSQAFEKTPGNGVNDLRNFFKPANRQQQVLPVYQQVFGHFETNLCILDLLFNMGPYSVEWLLKQ
jgi:hypothetical protein